MKITDIRVEDRSHRRDEPVRDALQTLDTQGLTTVTVTADGLEGVGHGSFGRGDGAPRALAEVVERVLAPVLLGRDATLVGGLLEDMKREAEYHGLGGLTRFGISALDTALWDLLGKAHGVPCYQLWGAQRERLPAYAMIGWSNFSDDDLRKRCLQAVEQGFRAVKMKVGAPTLEEDVRRIEAVREEIGHEIPLMADANQALTFAEARRRGLVFAELGLEWFEEPIRAHDLEGYAELTSVLPIPIATGENLYGKEEFLPFFARRACRVIQPDLRRAGGPSEVRMIGSLAAAYDVPYASHGGGPAALNLLLAAPSAVWLETGVRTGNDQYPILEDGYALAPTGAGFAWA